VARGGDRPVGLIDVRSGFHICLFFVDLDAQGQGIGRALFDAAVERCGLGERAFFEVNSSLFAVPIYEKLGFRKKSGVRLLNGIRFVEMVYDAEP
jgi:GNAT superfamily N-acetyltransferase